MVIICGQNKLVNKNTELLLDMKSAEIAIYNIWSVMELDTLALPPVNLGILEEDKSDATKTSETAKANVLSHPPECSCSYSLASDGIQDGKDEKHKGGGKKSKKLSHM